MVDIIDMSVVAGSNTLAPPNGFPENMDYDAINDSGRELMAALARDLADRNATQVTTGTQPNYALTLARSGVTGSYPNGLIVSFRCHSSNNGSASTIDVNGIGVVDLDMPDGSAPNLVVNGLYVAIYSNTSAKFIVVSATAPEAAAPGFTNETVDRALTVSDVEGDYVNVGVTTVSPIVFTVPSGLAAGSRIRFTNSVNAAGFTIRNSTGTAVIYGSDSTTITNGGTQTYLNYAYTLVVESSTRIYLLDYFA